MMTLYTNEYNENDFENMKNFLEAEQEGEPFTENDVWESYYELQDLQYKDFEREIEDILRENNIIVKANVGFWNGRKEAYKLLKNTKDFRAMLQDFDYMTFTEENKHIFVELVNHDATTYCEMKLVNKRGNEYIERQEYLSFDQLKVVYKNYSKLIRELCY